MPDALSQIPFAVRLLVLLGVLSLLAALDAWRSPEPRRAREYGFLLACGAAAGAFGAGVDVFTVRVSPDYFTLGKGLAAGPGLVWRAPSLGFQAGFPAGLLVGGLLLLANQPHSTRPLLSYGRLARATGWIAGAALLLVGPGAAVGRWLDPLGLAQETEGLLSAPQALGFCTAWGAHAGVYAGATVGLAIGLWRVRAARPAATEAEAESEAETEAESETESDSETA